MTCIILPTQFDTVERSNNSVRPPTVEQFDSSAPGPVGRHNDHEIIRGKRGDGHAASKYLQPEFLTTCWLAVILLEGAASARLYNRTGRFKLVMIVFMGWSARLIQQPPYEGTGMRTVLAALALLGTTGPVAAQTFARSGAAVSSYPALVATDHDHRRVAPQASSLSKEFSAFFASFDDADDDDGDGQRDVRLNPDFVVYELRGLRPNPSGDYAEPQVSIERPTRWYTSPELVPLVDTINGVTNRRLDDSYRGAGAVWNRGHLAMSDHAQRISAEASCNTHIFWNASPQANDLNQGPWMHLENYSAAASNKYRSIWVIAGPIFDPATPRLTIGDAGELPVEIPDAFFKVLVHESPSGIDTLAFIFEQPNALDGQGKPVPTATWVKCSDASSLGHVYDHRPRLVSIAQIEQRTGLKFFLDRPDRQHLTNARATSLWTVEARYWDPSNAVCARQRGHP